MIKYSLSVMRGFSRFYPGSPACSRAVLLVLYFCAIFFQAQAQCPGAAITLTSQAEVTNFPVDYPGCTVMPVGLTVSGPDIVNLNGLSVLTGFENTPSLTLEDNPLLTSLTGLSNITAIPGSLKLINNDALISLGGLSNLTSIGFSLTVDGNAVLSSLSGLSNVNSIGGYIDVEFNPAMTSFGGGLNNVASLGQFLQINNNGALTTLNGLNGLTSVGQYVFISSNNALTSVNGLSSLSSVGGDFELSGLPSMTSLGGLTNLSTVGGALSLILNTSLTDLDELANITNIGGDLTISFNTLLAGCAAQGICDYVASPNGAIAVNNNATGCATLVQIQTACGLLPVELIDFKAVIQSDNVKLEWSTANEKDNLGYNLERSANGQHWTTIGFIPGKGTTTDRSNYDYMDANPIHGANYYRLKQVDLNGKSDYSPVVVADMRTDAQAFDIFPNPSSDGAVSVRTFSHDEGDAFLEIFDYTGARVFERTLQLPEGTVIYPFSLETLPAGAYSARLELPDGQVQYKKFLLR